MVSFPNAKINLGLNVIRRRADGYHDLQTVFYPVPFYDVLEIIPLHEEVNSRFEQTGLTIAGDPTENLCVKASDLLRRDFPELPPLHILLHKSIPTGAGLGGGSADASFTIKMLNQHFQLGLSTEQMTDYALQLGSDCPFFIINKPCMAEGRGEKLEQIELDLSAYDIVLINPGIHVQTAKAFGMLTPKEPMHPLREIIAQPVETWRDRLRNDFEEPVFAMHPPIAETRELLYRQGALYASMSGSGSSVYGIFRRNAEPVLDLPDSYLIKRMRGSKWGR